jgi:hypothetical protein
MHGRDSNLVPHYSNQSHKPVSQAPNLIFLLREFKIMFTLCLFKYWTMRVPVVHLLQETLLLYSLCVYDYVVFIFIVKEFILKEKPESIAECLCQSPVQVVRKKPDHFLILWDVHFRHISDFLDAYRPLTSDTNSFTLYIFSFSVARYCKWKKWFDFCIILHQFCTVSNFQSYHTLKFWVFYRSRLWSIRDTVKQISLPYSFQLSTAQEIYAPS